MSDEPTTEQMLSGLEAMYFVWFSNGPEGMSTEGQHKEIYDAIRRRIERKVNREWIRKWTNFITKSSKSYMQSEYIVRTMLKELGLEVGE
jgi:hypothetical protein